MNKIIIFDIWGDYAHFKKPYTTTSPLSYSIPSRTTLTGIIGAILGIEKLRNNIELNRENANISLGIINPIKKIRMGQNFINTKSNKFRLEIGRSPIKVEYIVEPKYRIYIEIKDSIFHNKLKEILITHKSIFTPSLGLSENIANYKYIGEYEYTIKKENFCPVSSVFPKKKLLVENISFDDGMEYFSDRFAMEMNINREVLEYDDVLFEKNGKSITIKNIEVIKINNNENIIWL